MWKQMFREMEKIIYRLKRQYPTEIIIRTPTTNTPDYENLTISRTYQEYTIERAVVLTKSLARIFVATGTGFKFGGYFDEALKHIIIDGNDLATGYIPTEKDSVVMNSRVYEVDAVSNIEGYKGFLLRVKEISRSDSV